MCKLACGKNYVMISLVVVIFVEKSPNMAKNELLCPPKDKITALYY